MRYVFIAALLGFILFDCSLSFADSPPRDKKEAVRAGIQIEDRDSELPDDPLGRKPAGEEGTLRRTHDADILPSLDRALSEKMRRAVQAIRDAIRGSRIPPNSDIPIVFNESVDRHIRCFSGPKRDSFAHWLVRAKKYEPTIRRILRRNDLPEDLVYVAMIESGFNMKACSRANAMGPWQFTDETGRQYGLRVDYWMDERYNLEKSTVAAARYLKKLFDQFGCWYLVAASYNAGENRVKRAMEDGRTEDFWELREQSILPQETREYVPQLIAAAIIAKDPERYGFTVRGSIPVYKLTKVSVPGGVPLRAIARTASVGLADLRVLNPELLQGIVPPDMKKYHINLPGSQKAQLSALKIKQGLRCERRVVRVLQHRMKSKDTAKTIERRYHVTQDDLLLVNAGGLNSQEGQILYIPQFASGSKGTRSPKAAKTGLARPRTTTSERKQLASLSPKNKADLGVHAAKKRSTHGQGAASKHPAITEKPNPTKSTSRKIVRLD